jgi:Flp pilus assembly protein TadG
MSTALVAVLLPVLLVLAGLAIDGGQVLVMRRDTQALADGAARAGAAQIDEVALRIAGIGQPYTDPHSPSPVVHKFRESSRARFDQGGFDVHLQARWGASAVVTVTTDGAVVETASFPLPDRVGDYHTLVQVRESQPVQVAASP